jgi:hypothetical protein
MITQPAIIVHYPSSVRIGDFRLFESLPAYPGLALLDSFTHGMGVYSTTNSNITIRVVDLDALGARYVKTIEPDYRIDGPYVTEGFRYASFRVRDHASVWWSVNGKDWREIK